MLTQTLGLFLMSSLQLYCREHEEHEERESYSHSSNSSSFSWHPWHSFCLSLFSLRLYCREPPILCGWCYPLMLLTLLLTLPALLLTLLTLLLKLLTLHR